MDESLFPVSKDPQNEITLLIHLNRTSHGLNIALNINNEDMKQFGITPVEFNLLSERINCILQQIIGFPI